VAAIAGSFIGLVLGGVLAEWDWHAVFWVSVPIGVLACSRRSLGTTRWVRCSGRAGCSTAGPGRTRWLAESATAARPRGLAFECTRRAKVGA
jgi:MFS family permease